MAIVIPRDKSYPPDAVQCDDCGGAGVACVTCEKRGWLPAGHPKGRLCAYKGCGKPLRPSHFSIYCSNLCAEKDA